MRRSISAVIVATLMCLGQMVYSADDSNTQKPFDSFRELDRISGSIDEIGIVSLKTKAQNNDAFAQAALGYAYYFGKSINQDFELSHNWFLKSALQGNITAAFYLAGMYDDGKGCDEDPNEALKWWIRCAKAGDIQALLHVGARLKNAAFGVNSNLDESKEYLLKAAKFGNTAAMILLSEIYFAAADVENGIKWLTQASWQNPTARYRMASIQINGKIIPKNLKEAYYWGLIMEQIDKRFYPETKKYLEEQLTETERLSASDAARDWLDRQKTSPKDVK